MINVIHVLTDKNIGGAGRWLLNVLRETDRSRYRVRVLLPDESLLREPVESLGYETLTVSGMADRSWDKGALKGMTELFCREQPDVIHVGASLTARIAARRAGKAKVVVTKHCSAERGSLPSQLIHRVVDTVFCDAMTAVSASVGRELAAGGTPQSRICVIPNGISPVEPESEQNAQVRRETLGLTRDCRWVGIAARLEPVKGVDLFLDAARKILDQRDDVRFAVFGTGTQQQELREKVRDLGEKIRFLGFVNEIERSVALLDVLVVSSRKEAFCLSAAEAMSMGVPVVAFDVDGVNEVVRHEETGLLVPLGDTDAMAAAVIRLLDQEPLLRKLAEQGRADVDQKWTARSMTKQIEALYEKLLGGQKA